MQRLCSVFCQATDGLWPVILDLGAKTDCNRECSICVMDGGKLVQSQPELKVWITRIAEIVCSVAMRMR